MSKFLKGTIILLIAGFITRILGFINRIVIARFIGEEGVGLYMMAFPTLMLVITITQLGLPVAISKRVAEAEAKRDYHKIKNILVVSLSTTIFLSALFTPALFFMTPFLSNLLFTDSRVELPLLAITPVIPVIAISSVIRGYFQGRQNMRPTAIAQVLEQLIRISCIALLTKLFLPYGIEYAAAGAMLSAVLGELVSLIYLFASFKIKKKFPVRKRFFKHLKEGKATFKELMGIGLPSLGSRLIGNISWFFEPIVVAHSLALAGIGTTLATKQYGSLTGLAMPLLLLPSFITVSLSTSLVPAISEAHSRNDQALIEYRLQQAIRFVLLTGGISLVVLYILAEPIMEIMYGSTNGAVFVKMMAPFFLFNYVQAPLQATLQALDLARAAMINSLMGAIFKLLVIFLLASQPSFGIHGAAIGILAGMVLVTVLHFATILKVVSFTFYLRDYIKMLATMVLTGWIGYKVFYSFHNSSDSLKVLYAAFIMSLVYYIFLLLFRLIRKKDVKRIPVIGRFLSIFAFR